MATAVYCVASSESQARTIVDQLKAEGCSADDISVLFPDKRTSSNLPMRRARRRRRERRPGPGQGLCSEV